MDRSTAARWRSPRTAAAPFLAVASAFALGACGGGNGGTGTEPPPSATALEILSGDDQTATVDQTLPQPVVVRAVTATGGGVPDVQVDFAPAGGGEAAPASATTDASGRAETTWRLGRSAGPQELRISAPGLPQRMVGATAEPGPVAAVMLTPATVQLGGIGATRDMQASAADQFGNAVEVAAFDWVSADPSVVTVDGSGRVTAVDFGSTQVTASTAGESASATVTVVDPSAVPSVSAVEPATLQPSGQATIRGENFGADPGAVSVTIAGVTVDISSVTPTEIQVTLPGPGSFPCEPAGPADIAVDVAGLTASALHPLRVANRRTLGPGESLVLVDSGRRCNELDQADGARYLVTVFNASGNGTTSLTGQIRGTAPGGVTVAAAPKPVALAPAARLSSRLPLRLRQELLDRREEREAHARILEMNTRLMRELARRTAPAPGPAPGIAAALAQAAPGDTVRIFVPNIDGPGNEICDSPATVRARVVTEGQRAIVLEDVDAPLAGQVDADLADFAGEFDQVMFPILTGNFGDPFVLDAQLDANGKMLILFSDNINEFAEGRVLGFVFNGDIIPGVICAATNQAEIFYAVAPTDPRDGFPTDLGAGQYTVDSWRRRVRSTLVHEGKHLVAFANRIAQNGVSEESWLEEGSAHMAEELYARAINGYAQLGNVTYDESIFCEVRPTFPQCAGTPLAILDNFAFLYDYLEAVENRSPLLDDTDIDEGQTFRGSAWMMLRWVIDHHAASEADFLRALTLNTGAAGTPNLGVTSGIPFRQILWGFSLANALDDRPGFTPADPTLLHPSWDTRDIFFTLANEPFDGNPFPEEFPLPIADQGFGGFTRSISIRGGTATFLELSGAMNAPQTLELRGVNDALAPPTLGIAIVRVQ